MKTKKKALALALCAVLLVVTSVLGTMAYLTDTDTVTNTFTVGKVHIDLDEAKVDEMGNKVGDDRWVPTDDDPAQEYRLLPGHTYVKDPTVTVLEGSEDCYVRMMATITYNATADDVFAKYGEANNMSAWLNIDYASWQLNGDPETTKDEEAKTITRTYEFRYVGAQKKTDTDGVVPKSDDPTKLEPLFTTVTVPGLVTNEEIATLQGMSITVVAQAIQADGFDTADEAWAKW